MSPTNLTQTGRREILHLLRSHDLSVSAIVCPLRRGLDVAENLEPRLEQIRDAMTLAFELGPRLVIIPVGKINLSPLPLGEEPGVRAEAPQIIIPSSTTKVDAGEDHLKESLAALGKHGDRIGVTVALDAGLNDPAEVVAYLDRLDTGSIAVNFNPAHLVQNGYNPNDAVRTFARRLVHAHAQDARRVSPSKLAVVPVGHGDIDWIQLLAHFEEIEYRGYLTVLGDDAAELGAGLAFLRRFVT